MKKKIIITILGVFVLMGMQVLINIFVFHKEMGKVLLTAPLWTFVYSIYVFLMIKKYGNYILVYTKLVWVL
jgi:hypothetical protein